MGRPATPNPNLPAPYGDASTKSQSAVPEGGTKRSQTADGYPTASVPAPYGDSHTVRESSLTDNGYVRNV